MIAQAAEGKLVYIAHFVGVGTAVLSGFPDY